MKIKFYIITVFIFLNFLNCSYASVNETLSKIENSIYGYDYSKDSELNRVIRLEKTIYGKNSTGDINKRITRINRDISADVIGLEIPAVKDTFLAEENAEEEKNVNYPIVDEIEQKLFNTTYRNRDFHTRIVTIEKKLFGKIYDVDDYSKRMERIKSKIMPETIAKEEIEYDYDGSYYNDKTITSMDFGEQYKSKFRMPFGQKNYSRPYTNYGEYGSNNNITSGNDNLNDELSQMEYDMFGTEFSGEDTQTRIKRLNSVNKAKKSSRKYDSQKFAQHMSTAMEIGAMILMILAMVL